eukprot:233693-Pleurochrysis_carterae.AAC.3
MQANLNDSLVCSNAQDIQLFLKLRLSRLFKLRLSRQRLKRRSTPGRRAAPSGRLTAAQRSATARC